MRVDIQGDADSGVPQALGDHLGVDAGLKSQGGVRMSEIVESDPGLPRDGDGFLGELVAAETAWATTSGRPPARRLCECDSGDAQGKNLTKLSSTGGG